MSYTFRPALTSEAKPLIGIYSESGTGKTFSALLLAKGFAGDMSLVGMIETESGRGEVFADDAIVGGFKVLSLRDDFSPKAYGAAIDAAGKAGLRVLIIDSASHEWEGAGGVLGMAAENQAAGKKGPIVWQKPKMDHQREFMLKLMQTPVPLVIVCMRAKYPMKEIIKDGKKEWSRSETLEPKQADDILFELMVHGWCDKNHNFHVTKYTKEAFKHIFIDNKPIDVATGERLAAWASGAVTKTVEFTPIDKNLVPAFKPAIDHSETLRKLLVEANIPEDEFLKVAQRASLSEITDLTKASAWISKNKRASTAKPSETGTIFDDLPANDGTDAIFMLDSSRNVLADGEIPPDLQVTYAQVADKINKSDASDVLEIAGDLIQFVPDLNQRNELGRLYKDRFAELREQGK
jgi:hypothetical protein